MKRGTPALDRFRLLAAVLVVAIHTSPLSTYTALGDFYLTRVLGRVAVPFFLMVSGYFLALDRVLQKTWTFWKKTALLYGVCIYCICLSTFMPGSWTEIFPDGW